MTQSVSVGTTDYDLNALVLCVVYTVVATNTSINFVNTVLRWDSNLL